MYKILVTILLLYCFTLCSVSIPKSNNQFVEIQDSISLRELGHQLFFDKRLSFDQTISCSRCHDPILAFTDGYKLSLNSNAESLLRNAPTLLNINNRESYNWANPNDTSLRLQMQRPLYGKHPKELNIDGHQNDIILRLASINTYRILFKKTFGQNFKKINFNQIEIALAYFIEKLQSRNSKLDQFLQSGDSSLLSHQEWRGFALFHSDSIDCSACHGGIDFFEPDRGGTFANIGLYNCNSSYPLNDLGVQNENNDSEYNGLFRIPSLRNIALTSPYYHDGSEEDLEKVIRNYERGGRKVDFGNCKGDGRLHPNLDGRLQEFQLSEYDRKALISFLHCLTDTSYLKDDRYLIPEGLKVE